MDEVNTKLVSSHKEPANGELLKEVHERNPFLDGKIVVVGGSEYSYFAYPPELPRKFLQ